VFVETQIRAASGSKGAVIVDMSGGTQNGTPCWPRPESLGATLFKH
jgi:hypothetical protein